MDIGDPKTGTSDIWVFDLDRGVSTRLHSDAVDEILPVWSPDGSAVFYRSDRQGPPDIYAIRVGIPGSEKQVLREPLVEQPEDVSPDGRLLVYGKEEHSTARDIWLLDLSVTPKPIPWLRTRFDEVSPRFSPDGRWIAYESNESGDPEIYAALREGGGEKKRISPSGGRKPRWRRDGRELYYLSPNGLLMAVPVAPGTGLEAGAPAGLFRMDPPIENYDVAPDGSRFVVTTRVGSAHQSPLRVILNWPAVLR
ncbi:MAG: PD40 domain-containing protein [Thermoanaerobaculia bacterium]|nr:PD40 domain-containing protein [Thermoanaerobaculia bacterium]